MLLNKQSPNFCDVCFEETKNLSLHFVKIHLLLRLLLVNSSLFFKGTKGGKDLVAETDILVVLPNQHGSIFSANQKLVT